MSHKEDKKQTKTHNEKSSRPETTHDDEMKKQPSSRGTIGERS